MTRSYIDRRQGLPNLARRLAAGEPLTVAYLGGSLTMMGQGWRPLLHEWFNQSFPRGAPHTQLHVGRGGVGSASGAFFVQDEICGHDPDLVFVEYAINDSFDFITPPALRAAAMEGIVRNIRQRHPACDICFVHMHHVLRTAEIEEAVRDHEAVAAHYGIPCIHVGRYLRDLVDDGAWSFRGEDGRTALLRDECHPHPDGNRLVTELIAGGVLELVRDPGPAQASLPAQLCDRALSGGRVVPLDPAMIHGPFEERRGPVGNIGGEVLRYALPLGSRLEVRLPGTVAGLYVVVGPQSGIIRAQTGTRAREHTLFDRWCSYERISTCILLDDTVSASTGGTVIGLTEQQPDYSVCTKLEAAPTQRSLDVVGLFML